MISHVFYHGLWLVYIAQIPKAQINLEACESFLHVQAILGCFGGLFQARMTVCVCPNRLSRAGYICTGIFLQVRSETFEASSHPQASHFGRFGCATRRACEKGRWKRGQSVLGRTNPPSPK
ncbi:unnamed protein product [Effrenium voratum]|nr:unnamed protein product [Effrenium voratum]